MEVESQPFTPGRGGVRVGVHLVTRVRSPCPHYQCIAGAILDAGHIFSFARHWEGPLDVVKSQVLGGRRGGSRFPATTGLPFHRGAMEW